MKKIFPACFIMTQCLLQFLSGTLNAQDNPGISAENGLVVYLPFSGNTDDASGNGYNGVVKRATLCDDRRNSPTNACCFNGSDNYLYYENVKELDTINSITVCAWIFPKNYYFNDYAAWVSKPVNENFSQLRIGFGREPEKLWGLTLYNNNTWNEYYAESHIPLNEWSYVVFTADPVSDKASAYLNGKEVGKWDGIVEFPPSRSPLYIAWQPDDNSMFHGAIDEVRIYNRVLTTEEIITLYQQNK